MHADELDYCYVRLYITKNSPSRADPAGSRSSSFARYHQQLNLPFLPIEIPQSVSVIVLCFATEAGSECYEFESVRVEQIRFEYIPSGPTKYKIQ